jgi:hypothetical protein
MHPIFVLKNECDRLFHAAILGPIRSLRHKRLGGEMLRDIERVICLGLAML